MSIIKKIRTGDSDLDDYLSYRADTNRAGRELYIHPEIFNRKMAMLYWLEITRQDMPVFMLLGIFAGGLMLLHVFCKGMLFLLHLLINLF